MGALVVKKWKASDEPVDQNDTFIMIVARSGGLISKLRELMGIDPTSTLRVTSEKMYYTTSALAGIKHYNVPLRNLEYTMYGYYKPWREALGLFFSLWFVLRWAIFLFSIIGSGSASAGSAHFLSSALAFLLSLIISVLYYFLKREVLICFRVGEKDFKFRFKRSVIENQQIDETQAAYVSELIEYLADEVHRDRRELVA